MSDKLETVEEIDKWVEENATRHSEVAQSVMQEIVDVIAPEMCGYVLVKLGAHKGY